jgi:hypothetical protein
MSEEDKKRVKLVRMPDGSMRPTTESDVIGDIWGSQKKIAKQDGGVAKNVSSKKGLFGRRKKQINSADFTPKIIEVPKAAKQLDSLAGASPNPKIEHHHAATQKQETTQAKEIAIELSLPSIPLRRGVQKLGSLPKKYYGLSALVLVPVAVVAVVAIGTNGRQAPSVQGEQVSNVPDYAALTPNGDITDTTSQKISYDPAKKVSSYTDKINGFEVTVSMQPIPDTFKPAIGDNVKKVADQFAATTVLDVDNGAAYLGTSPKGPQSFVGYRGELLVFMTSLQKIEDAAWAEYFNSLK